MEKILKLARTVNRHVLAQAAIALLSCVIIAGVLASCATKSLQPGEGFIDVNGGKVWYKIVGSGTKTPLLLVHGGPGSTSYYLNPLAALADERPVIFYDQLGCGRSTRTNDTALWTIERSLEELAAVRQTLGLKEVHLFGHSIRGARCSPSITC
ncbi:MAG: alpha/beta fold hydrolase [candidate division KSB1 bacterium]